MSLSDLQACPWCKFVGTPIMFDFHMEQEHSGSAEEKKIIELETEIRRLKAQMKERQKDYFKTLKESSEQVKATYLGDWRILREIAHERLRQDELWGEQNHPSGTNTRWAEVAEGMKAKCESKASKGTLTFRDIFEEEIWEAYSAEDPDLLRGELVQCAAVLVNWIGAIDRRKERDKE